MRATCEACGELQPVDWKPGDQCVHCGRPARREVRCFWCAKWTPFAKFCRSCGAAVVEETQYGPARMLKDAGTDRFTIPKMLRELDPDQIENFARIYARHAAAVARHVEEVRFLERFLFQKTFSRALEDELVPQLPWNETVLERMTGTTPAGANDLATARALAESTPFAVTRALALLARVRLDDWKALEEAHGLLGAGDPALRAEAALVVSGWRVRTAVGRFRREERLIEELERSPFRLEAAVRLGLLGRGAPDLLKEALGSRDRETSFAAALALGEVDRLRAALEGDDLEKIAAGNTLIELGVIQVVEEPIRKSPLEVQQELIEGLLRRKEPVPEMAGTLLEIVETTQDETLRERAARILCRKLDPAHAVRIARAGKGDRYIFQSLLSTEAAAEIAGYLLENGFFRMSQYGLKEAAERGAIADRFVPERFEAADEETRRELLRLAEVQLEARKDEALHRFLMNVVFGPYEAKTRSAAWWSLHRWYRSLGEHRGEGPFRLAPEPLGRFFGSPAEFAPRLAAVLRDRDTLKEVGIFEFLAHLLGSADPEGAWALASADLIGALLEASRSDYWPSLLDSMVTLLGLMGTDPRFRDQAIAGLEAMEKKGNYYWEKALRGLRCSVHGLPDEPEWRTLPSEFVPERFGKATPEGRLALLRVAEEQLIHGKHPALVRFLLQAALDPHDPEARVEAMRIWSDRGGRTFHLSRPDVEENAGPYRPFLEGVARALAEPAVLAAPEYREFLRDLLEHPREEAVRDVLAEGEGIEPFVRGLLSCAEQAPEDNLRHWAIQYAGKLGAHPRWRDVVVPALERLAAGTTGTLSASAKNALRELAPPPIPEPPVHRPPPRPVRPVHAPAADATAEKAKEAERLGKELQEAALKISFGAGSPEEKTREIMRLQSEFQERIRKLYGP